MFMIVCKYEYCSHFFNVGALCFTKKSYKKGCDNRANYKRNNSRKPYTVFVINLETIEPVLTPILEVVKNLVSNSLEASPSYCQKISARRHPYLNLFAQPDEKLDGAIYVP